MGAILGKVMTGEARKTGFKYTRGPLDLIIGLAAARTACVESVGGPCV